MAFVEENSTTVLVDGRVFPGGFVAVLQFAVFVLVLVKAGNAKRAVAFSAFEIFAVLVLQVSFMGKLGWGKVKS